MFDKTHKILDPNLSLVSNLFIILIGPAVFVNCYCCVERKPPSLKRWGFFLS